MGRRNRSDAGDNDVHDPRVIVRKLPGDGHNAGLEDDKRDPPENGDQAVQEQQAQTPVDTSHERGVQIWLAGR